MACGPRSGASHRGAGALHMHDTPQQLPLHANSCSYQSEHCGMHRADVDDALNGSCRNRAAGPMHGPGECALLHSKAPTVGRGRRAQPRFTRAW